MTDSTALAARDAAIRAAHAGYAEKFARLYQEWVENGAKGADLHDLMDPANECSHGRLPLDRNQVCRCWGQAPTLMTGPPYIPQAKERPMPEKTPRKRHLTPVPTLEPAPPVLAKVLADIEAEIARLERARALLRAA